MHIMSMLGMAKEVKLSHSSRHSLDQPVEQRGDTTPDGDQRGEESPPRVPEAAGHTTRTRTHLQIPSTTPMGFMAPPATEQALRSSADGAERCKAQLSPPGAEHLRTALCLGLCSSGFGAEPSTPRQEVSFLQN